MFNRRRNVVRYPQRQSNRERGTFIYYATHRDRAAHQADEFAADGQTQPRTAIDPGGGAVKPA